MVPAPAEPAAGDGEAGSPDPDRDQPREAAGSGDALDLPVAQQAADRDIADPDLEGVGFRPAVPTRILD